MPRRICLSSALDLNKYVIYDVTYVASRTDFADLQGQESEVGLILAHMA